MGRRLTKSPAKKRNILKLKKGVKAGHRIKGGGMARVKPDLKINPGANACWGWSC